MKYFSLSFLILLIDVLPLPDIPKPDEEKPTFNVSSTVPAIRLFDNDVTIDFKIIPSKVATIKEVFKVGHNENDFYSINNPNFYKTVEGEYHSYYTLPTRMYFDENGCYVRLEFKDATNKVIDAKGFYIKPVTPSADIDPAQYVSAPYIANNVQTVYNRFLTLAISEEFQFPDYIDYFNIDIYHRLDLDSISFTYNSIAKFVYGEAYLTYYDFDNVFPFISHYNEHRISIPLSVSINNKKATFSYKNYMYVHPKSLQMSLETKEGFVKTRYFYLPVNKKDYLLDEKMSIDLYEAGHSKNDIHWNLTYLANRDLIGDCDSSDYCVVGEEL